MNKLNKVVNYFRIVSGITLIIIGIYSEVAILSELSDNDINFTDGEDMYSYFPDIPDPLPKLETKTYPINENYHILIGLGLVAGAILLTTTKISIEN